jgi:hypothetical protein
MKKITPEDSTVEIFESKPSKEFLEILEEQEQAFISIRKEAEKENKEKVNLLVKLGLTSEEAKKVLGL